MAIVQISQITNRKGLQENLPQLAGAELGWSTDTRQLYIGNGTIQDGAPIIGNTEILTEFTDILNFVNAYTYKGLAAGYTAQTGPGPGGTPITLSLQSWLDQFASVLDFGAVGDGQTDDTDAINRALFQIYCRESNPQIRRGLFFPAGVYRVSGTIKIPPYATLWGEGNDNSVIRMDVDVEDYVARTADSLQNVGVNIGEGGATVPEYITISNMGFTHANPMGSIYLVQNANNCSFQNVGFRGASTTGNLTSSANESIGVEFASTNADVCKQITLAGCVFSGLVYGIKTDQQTQAVTVTTSEFNILYQGVVLGTGATTNGGSTGTRITGNMFDNIFNQGIVFGSYLTSGINASGHNIFYDVGNHFSGSTGIPYTSIISIESNNNISISDLFERSDGFAFDFPRVNLNNTLSIATTNGESLSLGSYNLNSGKYLTVNPNSSGTLFTVNSDVYKAFVINYTIKIASAYRTGSIQVAADNVTDVPVWNDDFVENATTTTSLIVSQIGNILSVTYTVGATGVAGTISYATAYLT